MSDEQSRGGESSKSIKRTPEIEAAIGARLRALRLAAGMSQGVLGAALGLSFQQIQKYEKGRDRIAASTLQLLASALGVHPALFFDGDVPAPTKSRSNSIEKRSETVSLAQISNDKVRKRFVDLVDALADKADT